MVANHMVSGHFVLLLMMGCLPIPHFDLDFLL